MGTIVSNTIIDKAQTVLQDASGVRWSDAELLSWLNDGQRNIALYKPNAYVRNVPFLCALGTRQEVPADCVQLFSIPRNLGATGINPGRAIRPVEHDMLDARVPNWHSITPTVDVQHFTYSVLNPKTFFVYPPNTGTGYVELSYGAEPPDTTLGAAISVDNIYSTALIDYVLYRAFSKDTEFADSARASGHFQSFVSAITGRAQAEAAANPNPQASAAP
jgi:hypothetical protein